MDADLRAAGAALSRDRPDRVSDRHHEATILEQRTPGVSSPNEHGIRGISGWPSDRLGCSHRGPGAPASHRAAEAPLCHPRSKRPRHAGWAGPALRLIGRPSPTAGGQGLRGRRDLGTPQSSPSPQRCAVGSLSDSTPRARDDPPGPTQEMICTASTSPLRQPETVNHAPLRGRPRTRLRPSGENRSFLAACWPMDRGGLSPLVTHTAAPPSSPSPGHAGPGRANSKDTCGHPGGLCGGCPCSCGRELPRERSSVGPGAVTTELRKSKRRAPGSRPRSEAGHGELCGGRRPAGQGATPGPAADGWFSESSSEPGADTRARSEKRQLVMSVGRVGVGHSVSTWGRRHTPSPGRDPGPGGSAHRASEGEADPAGAHRCADVTRSLAILKFSAVCG